ncbi:MAG TPA: hypothetical protein P5511_07175, partial [Candidatus Goldiibacteriota bacterium]|nr:hypothetical protein [Candidatus Goldiibacteriota bacterium]
VQIFEKSGGYVFSIDKTKGISAPQGIAVSDPAAKYTGYRTGSVFVIDGNNSRIQKFDLRGNLIAAIRAENVLQKEVLLTTLDLDYYGNVYVVDRKNSQVHKFSPDLKHIASQGKFGTGEYEFESPTGIAIYRHYGQIFVSDRESAQYFWIGSDVRDFKAKKAGEYELQFDFYLTEKGIVTIEIEIPSDDKSGKNVTVVEKLSMETGKNSICWPIPEEYRGTVIKQGENYTVRMRLMATYSSYPHIIKQAKSLLLM